MSDRLPVQVSTKSFKQLLDASDWPLALDSYQRGFVWGPEKLTQLANDLTEFGSQQDKKLPYYMGAVLLHHDASQSRRFIIDGQQRLTALSLLYHRITGRLPAGQELSYSGQSARRIRHAMQALKQQESLVLEVIEGLRLTVIEVDRADLAFTFFDTQNNRGVRLQATDLLKAYHLRAIDHAEGGGRKKWRWSSTAPNGGRRFSVAQLCFRPERISPPTCSAVFSGEHDVGVVLRRRQPNTKLCWLSFRATPGPMVMTTAVALTLCRFTPPGTIDWPLR